MRPPRASAPTLVLALALALAVTGLARTASAAAEDPDWPCIQRQIPEISAGMMWAGPSVEGLANAWKQDPLVAELVGRLVARRTPIEAARDLIQDFIDGLAAKGAGDKDAKLSLIFAGALARTNSERGQIIEGIKRYSRRQQALAERIEQRTVQVAELAKEQSEAARKARRKLEEQQIWDTRIFQEREQSLTYVCEVPVLLEQRLFALAREIMNQLE